MYRYLLFYYDHFYPAGGMNDCILKTNDYNDLEKIIREKYDGDFFVGTIAYYDAVEDKYFIADMKFVKDKDYFDVYEFCRWKESQND